MRPSFRLWMILSAILFTALTARSQAQSGTVGLEAPVLDRDAIVEDQSEKTFVPHWSGELSLSRSSQPAPNGQGQTQNDLSFTATDNLSESGNFISLGADGGNQRVEGNPSAYGTLSVGGGLGIGIFTPSLTVTGQYGEANVKNYSGTLNLDFQVFEPLTVGVLLGGGFQAHQGPVSQTTGTVNTKNWTSGLTLAFQAFNDLGFNASVQQQTDITYQFQFQLLGVTHVLNVNQSDRIPSVTLGADWDFAKDWALEGTAQYGREYYPKGTFYSPVLGSTVTYSQATAKDFEGYSASLIWNFDL
jgi:hypothetical protein